MSCRASEGPGLPSRLMKGTMTPASKEDSEFGPGDSFGVVRREDSPPSEAETEAAPVLDGPAEDSPGFWPMTSDAAVTSLSKFSGPLVVALQGFSCFVDHCSRCWYPGHSSPFWVQFRQLGFVSSHRSCRGCGQSPPLTPFRVDVVVEKGWDGLPTRLSLHVLQPLLDFCLFFILSS